MTQERAQVETIDRVAQMSLAERRFTGTKWGVKSRLSARALLAILLITAASCSSHLWWATGGKSNCGHVAVYRLPGRIGYLGSCSMSAPTRAAVVAVHVGDRVDIHIIMTVGTDKPHAYWPLLTSNNNVIRKIDAHIRSGDATFEAIRNGSARLSGTGCLESPTSPNVLEPCPLLDVTVD